MNDNLKRVKVLAEALPYIQKYSGKTIVVKYGGNAMINDTLREAVINDIVLLSLVGVNVVVVHGGGPEINDLLKRVGKESKFVDGLRYTDEETMELVQMVLCGKVNKDLVSILTAAGGSAIGLSGIDGGLFRTRCLADGKYGQVGEIETVNVKLVTDAIDNGYIPVVSTVGQGIDDAKSYNINADTAAAKLAGALGAAKLILLTDVAGILRDPKDESTLIRDLNVSDVPRLIKEGVISGGMIPKLACCVEAVRQGVSQANVLDGRVPHSVLVELLTVEGIGTAIHGEGERR